MSSNGQWYAGGLRFDCTACGNCCTGPPGYVWVCREEIGLISQFLGRADGSLADDQLRRIGPRYSLAERSNGDCAFLQSTPDGTRICSIYPVRPLQCRTWPFWNSNLLSPRMWEAAGRVCPGMNQGRHYSCDQIDTIRVTRKWW